LKIKKATAESEANAILSSKSINPPLCVNKFSSKPKKNLLLKNKL